MKGLKNVRHRRSDALTQVGWDRLESMLAAYYAGQGYRVEHCGTGASRARFDGGVDLKLRKDEAYVLVQCKHWNAKQVPHNEVHQLIGLMVTERATGAVLVTSGEFTRAAIEAAAKQPQLQLVDGDDLRTMLGPLPEVSPPPARLPEVSAPIRHVATHVGERLLSAAEDRIRHGAGGRGRAGRRGGGVVAQAIGTGVGIILAKVVFVLIGFLLLLAAIQFASSRLRDAAHRPASPQPVGVVTVGSPRPMPSAQAASMGAPVGREPTPEEIRESQRRADEAIRVIEHSTPEM